MESLPRHLKHSETNVSGGILLSFSGLFTVSRKLKGHPLLAKVNQTDSPKPVPCMLLTERKTRKPYSSWLLPISRSCSCILGLPVIYLNSRLLGYVTIGYIEPLDSLSR